MYLALIVFSTIAALMSTFMVLYLLFISKGISPKKMALSFFLIALTLRVLKSVFYFLAYPNMSNWFLAFGFLGFSFIGPFAYYYYKIPLDNPIFIVKKKDLLHLIFPVLGLLYISFVPNTAVLLYFLCLISMGIYLVFIYLHTFRKASNTACIEEKWDRILFSNLIILFITFLAPYIIPFNKAYAFGTAAASLTICTLFFCFLKYSPKLIKKDKKYTIKGQQKERIIKALEEEKLYKDSTISLSSFSDKVQVPQYIISQVTKDIYNKSFHGTINSLRIRDIQDQLKNESNTDIKIEEMAYDVGFNTTSAFYSVFKKETAMSPREYQKAIRPDYPK